MRYRPKNIAALNIALGGLPAQMRVEVESGIEIRAKTVGDLRKLTVWPENLAASVLDAGKMVRVPHMRRIGW